MPINAGEVEATLTARDNMSPAMQLAAARVQELEYKLGTLGTNSVAQFNVMNAQLAVAQERFDKMAASADGATSSVASTGEAAATTGQSMAQVEGIATRMIERFIILAAVRGAVRFTEDMFTTADALQMTSESLDINTTKLQEYDFAAAHSGVSTQQMYQAIDTLGKKLAGGSDSVSGALAELNLSYDDLWTMDPATRFDTVATAIAGVDDKLQRTGYEVALFGSDKIDSLVMKLATLQKQAEESGTIMGPDTVQKLSVTKQAFADAEKGILAIGAAWLVAAQDWYAYHTGANTAGGRALMNGEDISGNTDSQIFASMADRTASPKLPTAAPLANAPLDPNDKTGMAAITAAAQFETATAQMLINQEKQAAAAEAAANRYAKAWEKAQLQTEQLWEADDRAIEARAKSHLALIDTSEKASEAKEVAYAQARLDAGNINNEQFERAKIAAENKYYQEHLDNLKQQESQDLAINDDKEQKLMNALEMRYANGLVDDAQYEEQKAAIAEQFANDRAAIEEKYTATVNTLHDQEMAKEIADNKAVLAAKAADTAKGLADQKTAMLAQQNLDMGGSTAVNRGNLAQEAAYWNIPPDAAFAMAAQGFSLQEIISAWQNNMVAQWKPAGPRIPGFAEGGVVMVGEHGPEAIRAPFGSAVAPSGAGFGGAPIIINNYINGAIADLARPLMDEIMKGLKGRVHMGSA